MEKLLTVEEAAELLRITPRTLKEWCRLGKVPCVKVGQLWRLKASELEAWMRPTMRVVKEPEAEDQADVEAAREALAESERIPYDQARRELGV